MGDIIDIETRQTKEPFEAIDTNDIYLSSIIDHIMLERDAIIKSNYDVEDFSINLVYRIAMGIVNEISSAVKSLNSNEINSAFITQEIMQAVNALLSGGIISPLMGRDEEWKDITVPEDIGQKFTCNYRGKDYEIPIESVQINLRYPKIYRLNNDNKYAHRIDYVQFHDAAHPEKIHLTEDSIRFIQFPYAMESVHCRCIVNSNNEIVDYFDYDYSEIADGLVYHNQSSDKPLDYIVAPKIPFHMLEEEGIDMYKEIVEFQQEVDLDDWENAELENYDDDDDEYLTHDFK